MPYKSTEVRLLHTFKETNFTLLSVIVVKHALAEWEIAAQEIAQTTNYQLQSLGERLAIF